jgi:hypothetical protein
MGNWYAGVFRKIHFDMHTPAGVPDVGRWFVPDRFAGALAEAGYQAACIFTKCTYGWSYYPTRVGLRHPTCERDLFGEACAALHRAGLKVIGYYALEVLPPPLVAANPDLLLRQADGSACVEAHDRTCGCIYGPMLERLILPQLTEIAALYPVDGIFLDGLPMAFWKPCQCAACKASFGAAFPSTPDDARWPDFRAWQFRQQRRFAERVAEAIHAARPGTLVGINYLGAQPCSPIRVPAAIDYLTADISVHDSGPLNCSYQLAAWTWRECPCDVMNARMLGWWQDWSMRPLAAMQVEAAIGLARGGRLFMGDLIQPDSVQPHPAILAQETLVNDFARARESLTEGVKPRAEAAVVHDLGERFLQGANPDGTASRGAFLALLENAWPLHVLYSADIVAEASRYPLLVLTSGADLTAADVGALREYVWAGGNLLLCGPGAAFVHLPGVAELTGLDWSAEGEDWPLAYLDLAAPFWLERWPPGPVASLPPLLVQGRPGFARPRAAEILGRLTAPGALYQMGARPPGRESDWVGVSRHRLGAGQVVVTTLSLGRDYLSRGNTFARDLLHLLARLALGRPRTAEVSTPAALELNLAQGDGLLRLHLIQHTGSWRPGTPYLPDRVVPLHGLTLTLNLPTPPAGIRLHPGDLALPWDTGRNGQVEVRLPALDIHACVEVRW